MLVPIFWFRVEDNRPFNIVGELVEVVCLLCNGCEKLRMVCKFCYMVSSFPNTSSLFWLLRLIINTMNSYLYFF